MSANKPLDLRYLMFEDQFVDRVIDSVIKFPGGRQELGPLVSKGVLHFLEGKRELTFPPDVQGLELSDDVIDNEMAVETLKRCVLEETLEACRMSEPTSDGTPFGKAQAMWILMRVYNALFDLYDIGVYLPNPIRKSITDARKATARHRMRIDD